MKTLRTAAALLTVCLAAPVGAAPGPKPACLVPGVDDRCEEWVRTMDQPGGGAFGMETLTGTALSPDGSRLFLVGTTATSGGFVDHDFLTVALNPVNGDELWRRTYDGTEATDDEPTALVVSPDGAHVFVGGTVNSNGNDTGGGPWNADFGIMSYSAATGATDWVRTYDGFELQGRDYGNNQVSDIAVSGDGSTVYLTGSSLAGATRWDYGTFAYDAASGAERWRARYDRGRGDDRPSRLLAWGDRSYVIGSGDLESGTGTGTDGNTDIVIVAYEDRDPARLGQSIWVARRDTGGADYVIDAALTAGGDRLLLLTGHPNGYAVVAYGTEDGRELWTSVKSQANPVQGATALAVSPVGERFFVVGRSTVPQQGLVVRNMDYSTTAFTSSTGAELWTKTYGLPGATEEEAIAAVVNGAGTRVYVTGYSSEPYYTYVPVVATVAYDAADGTQKWVARHRRTTATLDHDRPVDAVISRDGRRLYIGATFAYRPDVMRQQIATSDLAGIAYDTCEQVCTLTDGEEQV